MLDNYGFTNKQPESKVEAELGRLTGEEVRKDLIVFNFRFWLFVSKSVVIQHI